MAPATQTISFGLALFIATAAGSPSRADDALSIAADAAVISIPQRDPGRRAMQLPTLEYQVRVSTRCSADRTPESLSISIADTRKSLAAAAIDADGVTDMNIRVPAGQIPPVVVEGFCVTANDQSAEIAGSDNRLTISSALSLQASLLCAGDDGSSMIYASRPLDVSLDCVRPATMHEEPSVP